MELEKQLRGLQADLEEERRDVNLKTETITDLQGETWLCITPLQWCVLKCSEERNNYIFILQMKQFSWTIKHTAHYFRETLMCNGQYWIYDFSALGILAKW